MIDMEYYLDKKWTYISRALITRFQSAINHFDGKYKDSLNKLTKVKDSVEKFNFSEHVKYIEVWNEHIEIAKAETDVILNFGKYLLVMDFENAKMKLHIKYIFKENTWLRSEMNDLHKLLLQLESHFLVAEAEKRYFQYYYTMRNYAQQSMKITSANSGDEIEEEEDSAPEEDVPPTLSALFNLVSQFISENRHLVASAWCKKSLADFKKKYGEISKEVGAVNNLLGRIYKDYKSFTQAKDYFEASLTIREKVYGKDSDQVGITLTMLGSTLGKLGQFKRGLEICKRALQIRENIYGKNNEVSQLYAKIAEFSFELKLWDDVISNYKICLNVFDNIYDITEYSIIKSYTTLGHAYLHNNVTNKALECLSKVNLAYTRKNNPGSSKTATPITVIEEYIKRSVREYPAEMLLEKFGTISETLDDRVVEVMIFYYEKTDKPDIVEMLKGWAELSNRNINRADSEATSTPKRQRQLSMSSGKPQKSTENVRRESITASVRQSIRGIFKGKK